jgi:hypothetical protein
MLQALEHPSEPLPLYNTAGNVATVAASPPFAFPGVTMRIFPLPADFHALGRFCDQYLNVAPDFARFRPSMPYVMLTIVNYGRMSVEAGNLGWTSQNEVLFGVPLEWYEPHEGRWVFRDLAQVAPFIFVDNEASQVVGREVYGWPKVQGWFAGEIDRWAINPRSRRRLLRLDTRLFRRLYEARRPMPRELLVVEEDPNPSFTRFPPQADGPLNPLVGLQKALLGWTTLFSQGLEAWTRIQLGGPPIDRRTLPDLVAGLLGSLDTFAGSFQANTINLKQFRDATHPALACYQAITNARMEITQVHGGGMLGDVALLGGDPSGGHRIQLHRYGAQPIVETLGLQVFDESEGEEGRVSVLKPVLPFWMKLDLRYLAGENVCWRTESLSWRNRTHECVPDPSASGPRAHPTLPHYTTTGSAGFEVAAGPFRFPGSTSRVLPLPADRRRLQALCDAYLNEDPDTGRPNDVDYFEVWGRYVYLIIQGFDAMTSESDDVGLWADKLIRFAVPVRWYQRPEGGGNKRLASVGLFSPFLYSNNDIQVTTAREVNGWEAVQATIEPARSPWLEQAGPFAKVRPLMEVQTEVFHVLGEGQESHWCTLFELLEGDVAVWQKHGLWSQPAAEAARELPKDFRDMVAALRDLAVKLFANGTPLNHFSLKQFRDTGEPLHACYQALVRSGTVFERLHELREIDEELHVAIHRYPTQPIVDTLGLEVHSRYATEHGAVDCIRASQPFFLRADLRTEPGETLACRAGSRRWERPPGCCPDAYFLEGEPTPPAEWMPEDSDSLGETLRRWAAHLDDREFLVSAARAVTSMLEPQTVIHSLLHRGGVEAEWGGEPGPHPATQAGDPEDAY